MKQKNMWTTGLIALSLFGVALPAAATATIWGTPTAANCSGGVTLNVSCTPPSIGGLTLTYTSMSDTGLNGALQGAYVGAYAGGLGVTSQAGLNSAATSGNAQGSQEAAVDNNDAMDSRGNYEMLLLTFRNAVTGVPTPVTLSALNITGIAGSDSDLTVLAYGGAGGVLQSWFGQQYSSLVTRGWQVVGNYADVAPNTATPVNSSAISSSYWLIGAYNNTFGLNLSIGDDYVKLLSVTTLTGAVSGAAPEPSSLMLAAVALLGLGAARRRRPA